MPVAFQGETAFQNKERLRYNFVNNLRRYSRPSSLRTPLGARSKCYQELFLTNWSTANRVEARHAGYAFFIVHPIHTDSTILVKIIEQRCTANMVIRNSWRQVSWPWGATTWATALSHQDHAHFGSGKYNIERIQVSQNSLAATEPLLIITTRLNNSLRAAITFNAAITLRPHRCPALRQKRRR